MRVPISTSRLMGISKYVARCELRARKANRLSRQRQRQRQQRHAAAFAVIVGTHDEDDVLDRYQQDQ